MPTKKSRNGWVEYCKIAFSFLTVIPIKVTDTRSSGSLAGAMAFFPLVGFVVGIISLILTGLIGHSFSERFNALLLVLFPIVLSGGLHVDGLADCFDAFFQGKNREDVLRVMKDARVGVFGVLSVVFLVLFKWELLSAVVPRGQSFLLALTISRWAHVVICYLLPDARGDQEKSLGGLAAGRVEDKALKIASAITIGVSLLLGLKGVVVLLLTWGFVFAVSRFFRGKIGGITGDCIGATGELSEVFVYLLLLITG